MAKWSVSMLVLILTRRPSSPVERPRNAKFTRARWSRSSRLDPQSALQRACERLVQQGILNTNPVQAQVAAVSVGVIQNRPLLDLDYSEDSNADVDLNVVMNGEGQLLELQGTAEGAPFSRQQLNDLLDLAEPGLKKIMDDQRASLSAG